jgi:hypothetical protein
MSSVSNNNVNSDYEIPKCTICFENMDDPQEGYSGKETTKNYVFDTANTVMLACKHRFHSQCFKDWENSLRKVHQSITCPICRSVVEKIEPVAQNTFNNPPVFIFIPTPNTIQAMHVMYHLQNPQATSCPFNNVSHNF